MTIDERFEKLTDLVGSVATSVNTLTQSVTILADKVEEHDKHIGLLIDLAERQSGKMERLERLHEEISRQFQAYLNTIHPKQ